MRIVGSVTYRAGVGDFGQGDLYLPAQPEGAPVVLVIHGGGWNAMDRHRMDGISAFLCRTGLAVFNIDYRLLPQAPWPACLEDCLAAAGFLLARGDPVLGSLSLDRIVVLGASAGGHLALMTGLGLCQSRVAGIVSIAGPGDLTAPEMQELLSAVGFLRGSPNRADGLRSASPVHRLVASPPPLLLLHSFNDRLVPLSQGEAVAKAWIAARGVVQSFIYDGAGTAHGIWVDSSLPPRLLPELEAQIEVFCQSVCRLA